MVRYRRLPGKISPVSGKPSGGDDQGQDEWLAVGAVVARVATLGLGQGVGIALEIGAGQLVVQAINGRAEAVLPFLGAVLLSGGVVDEQPVQPAIAPVLAP